MQLVCKQRAHTCRVRAKRFNDRLVATTFAACIALIAGCGDGGSRDATPETASACFNPDAYAPGAVTVAVYRPYDADSQVITGPDFVRTTSVTGPVSFQGTQTLDQFVTSESYGFHQYLTLEGLVVVVHGMTRFDRAFYDNPRSTTVSYNPPLRSVSNYSLRVGEAVTESPSVVVDGEQVAASASTLKFVGFEDVSTPAGVFRQTCHFAYPSTTDGVDTTNHIWVARTAGVAVQMTSVVLAYGGAERTVQRRSQRLVLATLNGVLIAP